jgi:hypothetical protein
VARHYHSILVGPGEQRLWHRKSDFFRSFDIENKLKLGWLLVRNIAGICAAKNLICHGGTRNSRIPEGHETIEQSKGFTVRSRVIGCLGLQSNPREIDMANRQQRSNREAKKPKKEKIKVTAAAPSQKAATWQPSPGSSGKKK